jgi:hypothetical protein
LDLTAKGRYRAYDSGKVRVERLRSLILKNRCAKVGKLLKTRGLREPMEVQNHWIAKSILYKDVMKEGGGTEFFVVSIVLNASIPDCIFSKAALKK